MSLNQMLPSFMGGNNELSASLAFSEERASDFGPSPTDYVLTPRIVVVISDHHLPDFVSIGVAEPLVAAENSTHCNQADSLFPGYYPC